MFIVSGCLMWSAIYSRGRDIVLETIPDNYRDEAYSFAIWSNIVYLLSYWVYGLVWLAIAKLNLMRKWKIQQKEDSHSAWGLIFHLAVGNILGVPFLTWYLKYY